VLSQDILMRDDTGQLQVTVVDRTAGLCRSDERDPDGIVEFAAPHQRAGSRNKPHPSHAVTAGVNGADAGRVICDDFFHSRWPCVEVGGEAGEVGELLANGSRDTDAMFCLPLLKRGLQRGEESPCARDR
jgi:hypothetical protein